MIDLELPPKVLCVLTETISVFSGHTYLPGQQDFPPSADRFRLPGLEDVPETTGMHPGGVGTHSTLAQRSAPSGEQ